MSEKIQIRKNVPKPENRGRKEGVSKYPLAAMEIDDSFEIDCADELDRLKKTSRLRVAIAEYRRKDKTRKFSVRKTEKGVGVWRVA